MKKLWILLAGILMAVIVAGCNGDKNDGPVDLSGNYVKPGEIIQDIEDGKTFGFVIVDKECSACQAYKDGALQEFEKNKDGELRYIEINGIEDKEEEFSDVLELIDEHLDGQFEATPTTYFFVNGLLESVEVGVMEYDELVENYNKNINGDKDSSENNDGDSSDENDDEEGEENSND